VVSSVHALLETAAHAVGAGELDAAQAEAHAAALGQVGRGLEALADEPIRVAAGRLAQRRLITAELGTACNAAAALWPHVPARVVDLAGAAADLVAVTAPSLDRDQRWAGAMTLADLARDCAAAAMSFPPYARVPGLTRVTRLCDLLTDASAADPSAPRGFAWLDRPIPAGRLPTQASIDDRVIECAASLVDELGRELRDRRLNVYTALATSAAAEECTRRAEALLGVLRPPNPYQRPPAHAAQSWRVLQAALIRFDDGSRHSAMARSTVPALALALHEAMRTLRLNHDRSNLDTVATTVRFVANQLPAIAETVEAALLHAAHDHTLVARARSLGTSEDHLGAKIHDRAVVVTPRDIGPVLNTARITARLSTSLAVELDRSAATVGLQPHPYLVRALADGFRHEQLAHDAAWTERLAARCAPLPRAPVLEL
jgi:hypothetical protein